MELEGKGKDVEKGNGKDLEKGKGKYTEKGKGKDVELKGKGKDLEKGKGKDTEKGSKGKDMEKGKATEVGKGDNMEKGKQTENGKGKNPAPTTPKEGRLYLPGTSPQSKSNGALKCLSSVAGSSATAPAETTELAVTGKWFAVRLVVKKKVNRCAQSCSIHVLEKILS